MDKRSRKSVMKPRVNVEVTPDNKEHGIMPVSIYRSHNLEC